MSHRQITPTAAARNAETEQAAVATYEAAYNESLRQWREDGDHAAFSARNKAASDAYDAAVKQIWDQRAAILDSIDEG